ncbi:hypothetical protein OAN307_c25970 [Octadecabacter antarcticus 307]|uniref:Uncharacterized protein n=1 Tax=Octadecabacter antarcticus 307 TaxID=391626 RepID=M9RCP6_9RHOB|nr:hypothetical protein OAN307_c25970 [Octadecabacter antarcticus 307]
MLGHVLHLGDQGRIHAAELGTPLVKTGAAHPMLSAQIRDRRTPSACFKMPMTCASLNRAVFIKNLLRYLAEKIPILNTINFRGDYRWTHLLSVESPTPKSDESWGRPSRRYCVSTDGQWLNHWSWRSAPHHGETRLYISLQFVLSFIANIARKRPELNRGKTRLAQIP